MSIILPFIFRKAKRTADEELEQLRQDQLRFGHFYQGLGKINGGKGWLDFYSTSDHCSFSSMISFFSGSLAVNSHDPDSWRRCEQLFLQYSMCLDNQALLNNYDPLEADSMKKTPGGVQYCYPMQDSMFKVCGSVQAQDFCDGRRRELFYARLRRRWILATRDLKTDFGWKPYPDWLFSGQELADLYGDRLTNSVYEKLTSGKLLDIFQGTYHTSHETRQETFTKIADLKEEMWPRESMSGSHLAYMKYMEEKEKWRQSLREKDENAMGEGERINAGPKQSIFGKSLGVSFDCTHDISYLSVDPDFLKYLENDPGATPWLKKNEKSTQLRIF